MAALTTQLSTLSVFLILTFIPIPSFSCPLHQKQSLLRFKSTITTIYKANSDPTSVDFIPFVELDSWKRNSDCCSWARVKCSRTQNVNELHLDAVVPMFINPVPVYSNILTPLFQIQSLKLLDISMNSLQGEIPQDGFGNLTGLVHLDMMQNSFNGSISGQLFRLPNLQYLDMSNNFLEGELGPDIYRLLFLDFSRNKFSGEIPVFGDNPLLAYIDLSYNEFSGRIPTSFSTETKIISLGGNKFSGDLPWNLTNLVNLERLDLHDNDITGNFQDILPQILALQVLSLRNNSIEGFIPRTISNLTSLRILDLSRNKLTGSIPQETAKLVRMIETSHMSAPGFDLSDLDPVEDLIVNWKNSFQGLASRSLGIYSFLDLSDNRISGEIPTSLGNLKGLKVLNISHNNISGHIPVSFGNLKEVESLDLSHNKISGSIPQSLAKLHELAILDVSNNRLKGRIPVGGQMDTINELKYFDNNKGLCGMQIRIRCPEDIPPSEGGEEDDEKQSWIMWEGAWIGFSVGLFSSILMMSYSLNL